MFSVFPGSSHAPAPQLCRRWLAHSSELIPTGPHLPSLFQHPLSPRKAGTIPRPAPTCFVLLYGNIFLFSTYSDPHDSDLAGPHFLHDVSWTRPTCRGLPLTDSHLFTAYNALKILFKVSTHCDHIHTLDKWHFHARGDDPFLREITLRAPGPNNKGSLQHGLQRGPEGSQNHRQKYGWSEGAWKPVGPGEDEPTGV